ncbi:hypothetical protein SUDANB145_05891 [Streptomyces sp. enrichment culture]|uniref:hypothetical protein n=1 Tax=Streptomyces sp. enrichment culture TaxID=1795815 RepID=UPI003F5630D9
MPRDGRAAGSADRRADGETAGTPRPAAGPDAQPSAARPGPAAPPPPPSARFPDTPPTVGRDPRGTDATARPRDARPAQPPAEGSHAQRPRPSSAGTPPRTAQPLPAEVPTPPAGPPPRPAAPAEVPAETTRRLRPVPPDPAPSAGPDSTRRAPVPAAPAEGAAETTRRLRPVPPAPGRFAPAPTPAPAWSATAPGGTPRPFVTLGEPEGYDDERARPRPLGRRPRSQIVAAAVCLVLGAGLLTGAVTGSWLADDSGDGGRQNAYDAAGDLWHNAPVDDLFPPTVRGQGAGPGGADRTWTRVAVAPDSGCAHAFDPLLRKALAPVGCARLLRATYTDATRSHVTTVGLLFTKGDAAAMTSLAARFEEEGLDRRTDLMPLPYAAKNTVAAGFGAAQRASWTVSVLTDAPVVVYAVSGWADGREVDDPQPAETAMETGATSAPAQAGLGHEARGLADRVERRLRKNVGPATEQPS